MPTRHDTLPRREREILEILVASDTHLPVEEIRGRLSDPPSYSAVRAMLGRLEEKGHVRHRAEGLRYVYAPTTARTAARRDALRRMVRLFFSGSPGEAAAALLRQESWSEEELDMLRNEIERIRRQRRHSHE